MMKLADILHQNNFILWSLCFVTGTFLYLFMLALPKMNNNFIRRILYVPARKSTTNAIQLGGFPFAIACLTGIMTLLVLAYFGLERHSHEFRVTRYWLFPATLIFLYGYLDDKFELRPIVKLLAQIISVFVFAMLSSRLLSPENTSLSFIILIFWGLGSVNGSNLLDGLDTLTIKIGSVTYLTFAAFGFYISSSITVVVSLVFLFSLWSFYLFNREPAKIHMGEIGGSFIGVTNLLLSCLLFLGTKNHGQSMFYNAAFALIPLTLPMVELGVSFLRRIFNRKSPFAGDRLHVHHILKNNYKFSASFSSTLMAGGYLVSMFAIWALLPYLHSFTLLVNLIILQTGAYVFIGKEHWMTADTIDFSPQSLFGYLRKKDVMIIDSSKIDDFQITIMEDEVEDDFEDDDDEKQVS